MKIGILTPEFPPDHSGLGDYSARLATELRRRGHEVSVWTATRSPEMNTLFCVREFPLPWSFAKITELRREMQEKEIDYLLVQYTPQSISPRTLGVSFLFPFWISELRAQLKKPVGITFHEVNYPMGLSLRGLLLGVPHFLQFILLAMKVDAVFFTTWPIWKWASRLPFCRKSAFWIPVGSNIPPNPVVSEVDVVKFKERHGIRADQRIILYFGGLHPTHLISHIKAVIMEMERKLTSESVVLVCIGAKNVDRYFVTDEERRVLQRVRSFSYLSAGAVLQWLQAADLVLAPFMDGISSRRSSVMVALQQGKAVLTTFGSSSDGPIPWSDFCEVVPVESLREYTEKAIDLIFNPSRLEQLGYSAKRAYTHYFDWSVWVDRILPAKRVK